ncbi:hypothetical protein JHK82_029234 [Glycine max]|nr:hypothetical protein JHK86_029345 [Glycine max]KAG5128399.1 hypothetical protein JHK82_029234 [Glycine max]
MRANKSRNFPGRTSRFYNGNSLYEFGHGLSYSIFSMYVASAPSTIMIENTSISEPHNIFSSNNSATQVESLSEGQAIDNSTVNCQDLTFLLVIGVKNNGPLNGSHVVLVFWEPATSEMLTGAPVKQLIGFKRVYKLCNVDNDGKRNLVIGQHAIFVGPSSETQVRHHNDVKLSGSVNGKELVSG